MNIGINVNCFVLTTVWVAQPTVLVAKPTVLVGQPTVLADQPTVLADQPTVLIDQPTVLTGKPTVLANHPTLLAGRPTVLGVGGGIQKENPHPLFPKIIFPPYPAEICKQNFYYICNFDKHQWTKFNCNRWLDVYVLLFICHVAYICPLQTYLMLNTEQYVNVN